MKYLHYRVVLRTEWANICEAPFMVSYTEQVHNDHNDDDVTWTKLLQPQKIMNCMLQCYKIIESHNHVLLKSFLM